jgi:uncharacterized protein (TIGR02145 family)/prepilin-type N-terminal cleavage/methylation domain-containing protein
MKKLKLNLSPAFTIVELLIVIVVIGVLSAVVIVSFTNLSGNANEASMKSELKQAHTSLGVYNVENSTYPTTQEQFEIQTGLASSDNTTYTYTHDPLDNTYCLQITNTSLPETNQSYYTTNEGIITEGECGGGSPLTVQDGDYLQIITHANCPSTRTLAVDARDNHTYWVQRITNEDQGYDQCWMLTNLAYAGDTSNGGSNAYNDVIPTGDGTLGTLNNGSGDGSGSATYTLAKYYIHPASSATAQTIYPAEPSTNTAGGGNGAARQYGYLYNWCAAMGAQNGGTQPNTTACANHATLPALPDITVSICPSGWRLPTGSPVTGEFTLLNNAINGGLITTDAGLRSTWLAQRSGLWGEVFSSQGSNGLYWSSTQSSSAGSARYLYFSNWDVGPANNYTKFYGFPVRCVVV